MICVYEISVDYMKPLPLGCLGAAICLFSTFLTANPRSSALGPPLMRAPPETTTIPRKAYLQLHYKTGIPCKLVEANSPQRVLTPLFGAMDPLCVATSVAGLSGWRQSRRDCDPDQPSFRQ